MFNVTGVYRFISIESNYLCKNKKNPENPALLIASSQCIHRENSSIEIGAAVIKVLLHSHQQLLYDDTTGAWQKPRLSTE